MTKTPIHTLTILLASAALIGCASGADDATPVQSLSAPSATLPATTQSAPSNAAPAQTQTSPPDETNTPDAQAPTSQYSDAQLRSFVQASSEVQPLTEGLAAATPDVRQRNTAAISAALQRHGLDAATYNNIATTAQTDTALAARIAALQTAQQPQDSAPATPPGGN